MINKLYVIAGPTAIGKSDFAIELARKINGVIINADSMQVYNNLHILTARPSSEDIKKIDHYLYGYVEGSERYNVAKWCNEASKKINTCFKKGLVPILVGGTGMYIDTLINGLTDIPSIPEEIKLLSKKILIEDGKESLINKIKNFDEASLININLNDNMRLRRIWEVFTSTKKTFSEWKKQKNKIFINNYDLKILLFLPDRKKNYEIVNLRFKKMIEDGAIDEVKKLIKLNLNNSLPVMRAHGVPEIKNFLEKKITIEECIVRSQQVTRNYVKRQHTWWNSSNLQILQKFDKFPVEIDAKLVKID